MLFSTRFFRPVCSALLLAGAAASALACSVQAALDSAPLDGVGAGDYSNSNGHSASGAGAGGRIDLPSPDPPTDGKASFTDLCGGGCMTGDKALGCSNSMSPEGSPLVSCQIVATNQVASAVCMSAGKFGIGEPCETASDCAASLGCVRPPSGVAVCRPYCCGDVEACEKNSICAPVPMAEAPTIHVPVCAPTTPCTLLDDNTCPTGLTCTLMRADGTTDCVPPGAGKLGEPCPCAPGHICSIDRCVALCHTDAVGSSECPVGKVCQGGSGTFPDGIGVCVP